jgi:hypothetical protein
MAGWSACDDCFGGKFMSLSLCSSESVPICVSAYLPICLSAAALLCFLCSNRTLWLDSSSNRAHLFRPVLSGVHVSERQLFCHVSGMPSGSVQPRAGVFLLALSSGAVWQHQCISKCKLRWCLHRWVLLCCGIELSDAGGVPTGQIRERVKSGHVRLQRLMSRRVLLPSSDRDADTLWQRERLLSVRIVVAVHCCEWYAHPGKLG